VIDAKNIKDLDTDLQLYFKQSKGIHEIIDDSEFQNRINDIGEDSLIIYIKKAQVYKIYNPEKLSDFENDDGTHYRKSQQYGPVYEVVRDTKSQKLIIIITAEMCEQQLTDVKRHISEFTEKNPEFSKVRPSDLKVYSNDANTEFLVSNIHLKNMSERDNFVEKFGVYMRTKDSNIANKIQIRPPLAVGGCRLYTLPSGKTEKLMDDVIPINTNVLNNLVSTRPIVINQTINNYVNINSNNVTHITKNKIIKKVPVKKTLKTFYKYINDTRPEWYVENSLVNIDIIEDGYRKYFNDYETKITVISRQLNGNLFTEGKRINKITKKKLAPYSFLQTLY
jgi:hypothetical protein